MRAHSLTRRPTPRVIPGMLAAIALAGCAGGAMPTPPTWLPSAEAAADNPYGAWARLELFAGDTRGLGGELVAAQDDSLFLFEGDSLRTIPADRLYRVHVLRDQGAQTRTVVFASGGSARGRAGGLKRLAVYARFPQGMPSGVDRTTLRPPRP